jgi:hypothetical protein
MAARRQSCRLQPSLPRGSVKSVLTHAQQAGRFAGCDQVAASVDCEDDRKPLHVAGVEAPVPAASDDCEEGPLGNGSYNGRPADAKALRCRV